MRDKKKAREETRRQGKSERKVKWGGVGRINSARMFEQVLANYIQFNCNYSKWGNSSPAIIAYQTERSVPHVRYVSSSCRSMGFKRLPQTVQAIAVVLRFLPKSQVKNILQKTSTILVSGLGEVKLLLSQKASFLMPCSSQMVLCGALLLYFNK